MSSALTVVFFRNTITADSRQSRSAEAIGGTWKALSKADATELPMTWLMPHQHRRPDSANRIAMTLFRFFPANILWI